MTYRYLDKPPPPAKASPVTEIEEIKIAKNLGKTYFLTTILRCLEHYYYEVKA
ncbi:MAG: hypothetical protein OEL77_00240 [Nitrosopumilus sp.]|nr:hypothetical protein [Nitrosopumilus sp.]